MSRLAALPLTVLAPSSSSRPPPRGRGTSGRRSSPASSSTRTGQAADGRVHLAYELLLINRSFLPPAKATRRQRAALADGERVTTLIGEGLEAVMVRMSTGKPGVELDSGEAAYVVMDVSFKRGAKLPQRLTHRLSISVDPANATVATTYPVAPTRVVVRPAVVIAPPLRGDGWLVTNGCCAELTSHRSALLPVNGWLEASERFAIDFIQIRANGLLTTGPYERLTSYPFFGDEVISASAGKVVAAVDRYPETPPGALPPTTAEAAGGNHVVVAMGSGRYAFYAHLQPGSVAVEVGERVEVGEPLGRLGSSGNSNPPTSTST